MSDAKRLRVFLSSPGDVLAARAVVRDVVDKLGADYKRRNAHIDIVSCDDPDNLQSLDAHLSPSQAHALGRPLPAECDVIVVIVWSRMGTRLEHDGEAYLSGTHYEFESAIRAPHPPHVLVYRWTAPAEQAWEDFATGETAEERQQQLGAAEQFVAGVRSAAIPITPFATISEFETLLSAQLGRALAEASQPAPAPSSSATEPAIAPPIIFLSAVSDEFRSYRAQLKGDLERAAQVPSIIQEYFDAVGMGTLGGLDARIRRCSAVIHLIGDMAGYFPPSNAVRELLANNSELPTLLGLDLDALLAPENAISYTQWEAYLAILHGQQLFIAEAARDAKREPASYRRDPAQLASQQAHRERLRKMDRWRELDFNGPEDIASKLLPALAAKNPRHFSGASIYSLGARQFDDYYLKGRTLDGRDVPAPFGGRQSEMAHLDRWLDDTTCDPRLLVSSPAGRGKSALLAKWMQALKDSKRVGPDGWQLVFVPISTRFQTNRATTYLELLTRQLAQVAREHVIPPTIDPEQFYRNTANRLITGLAESGRRALLIIDGLDEALGEERLANMLPATLPPTFKVLASARWIAEDREGSGWLTRLGWIGPSRLADHDLVVGKLDADAVADVLDRMGAPIEPIGRDRPLVTRLAELTEGEPLLLRFYAEDLWIKTSARSPITLDALNAMQPGFGPYFKAWLQDQGGVAAEAGTQVDPRTTDATLAILGFAKGALTAKDLLGVAAAGFPSLPWRLVAKPHVAPFRRFVIGDGSDDFPYVFSHPKVAEYIRTVESKDLADLAAAAFFAWGRAHLAALNSGQLRPEQASAYALDHYADHLKDVGETATAEHYMKMVEDGWRRAKERHDTGPAGFASDVRAAWAACRRDGDIAHLGAQWRCALVLSSINSLVRNIPGPLLVELVRNGMLSPQQAQFYAMLKGPTEEAVEALARIAVARADTPGIARALATVAIDLALSARNERSRVATLLKILDNLDNTAVEELDVAPSAILNPAQRTAALSEALSAVRGIADERERCNALTAVAQRLTDLAQFAEALTAARSIANEPRRSAALAVVTKRLTDLAEFAEALIVACGIADERERSWALTAVADCLTDPVQRTAILAEALTAARGIADEWQRSWWLAAVAERLSDSAQCAATLAEALTAARGISDERNRSEALAAIAERLTDPAHRTATLAEALTAARGIADERERCNALTAVAERLTDPAMRSATLAEALTVARGIADEKDRSWPLADVIARLTDPAQLAEALAAARGIADEEDRSSALAYVAQRLTDLAQFDEALTLACDIAHEDYRSETLAAVAKHLTDPAQFTEAVAAARGIANERERSKALAAIAERLTDLVQFAEALTVARCIADEQERCKALTAVAERLTDPAMRSATLAEALTLACGIADEEDRPEALAAIAERLTDPARRMATLAEALTAARCITDAVGRLWALAALAERLTDPAQRTAVLAEALTVAHGIADEEDRYWALAAVAAHLSDSTQRTATLAEALTAIRGIADEEDRYLALASVTEHLNDLAQFEEALTVARGIVDEERRSKALTYIAERVTNLAQRAAILSEALTVARGIADKGSRSLALAAVAERLSDSAQHIATLAEALTAASGIDNERTRSWALSAIAKRLTDPGQLAEAFAAARGMADAADRSSVLAALAERLTDPAQRTAMLAEALTVAHGIARERDRSWALAAVAAHLTEATHLTEALAAAHGITDERYRCEALSAVAAHLTDPAQLAEALSSARGTADERLVLIAVAANAADWGDGELMTVLLGAVATVWRATALRTAANTAAQTAKLGGQPALAELCRAISDVCCWYP